MEVTQGCKHLQTFEGTIVNTLSLLLEVHFLLSYIHFRTFR